MLELLLIVAAIEAYLIGGINGAIITSKYFYRKDIRKYGSGNPGLTNFYRVFGKGGVVLVIIIDVLKTAGPVLIGSFLFGHFLGMRFFGGVYAGIFVILGHSYPMYYGFKGGKGVMAMGTMLFFIDWRVALIAWGTFILLILLTKYVSLGSITGSLAYPVSLGLLSLGGTWELVIAFLSAALLIFRHRENIRRILKGNESKFSFHRDKKG